MKAVKLDTLDAGDHKFAAYMKARMLSTVYESTYGPAQRLHATRVQMCLENCYRFEESFVSFRKKFIAIKLHQVKCVIDKAMLGTLERDWGLHGITKIKTKQGITYRIPKV